MSEIAAEIIAGCRNGDRDAQHELYEFCCPRVYGLVARMVGPEEAPDVTQDVFLKIYRTIGQFSGRSQFSTWVYRLAVNECLQHLRRRSNRIPVALPFEPAGPSTSHGMEVELRDLLEQALSRLEPELRSLFLLREIDDLSYAELSEVLQVSEGTVGSRLNRARKQLKQLLLELGWEP